ncbi:hypothetical protein INT48_000855 [Thamnidium elegans]|uniref:Uncharacterized protein n=1 Tax=Thamnidium elegans TaxID=101142 RepID=A0A8H7VX67_9FUNG|nr:hypothetical protein INT48_000855 [Thamnidium elegans]
MAWLRSPKQFIKLIIVLVLLSTGIFVFLPNLYSTQVTTLSDAKPDDNDFINLEQKSNPWVISNSIYNNSKGYMEGVKSYTTLGHDYDTLLSLSSPNIDKQVTILLPIYSKESLSKIDSILGWDSDITFKISIISSSLFKEQIEDKIIDNHHIKLSVLDRSTSSAFLPGTAGASVWLQVLNPEEIETDYVYIMDETVIPSPYSLKELEYLFHVNQLDDYKNALIGTRALVLSTTEEQDNFCLPIDTRLPVDKVQPADMILGTWLLRKSWLPYIMTDMSLDSLSLPLGYYISLSLQQQLEIPTIVLPLHEDDQAVNSNKQLCEKVKLEWSRNTIWRDLILKNRYPTVLHYRQLAEHGVLVVAQGSTQLISLHPLLCRFKNYPVHLVILGNDLSRETVHHALKETNCDSNVKLYDFSGMKERMEDTSIGRLVKVTQPLVLIQIKPTKLTPMYYAIQSVANANQITEIGLPEKDIVHALWISDLSLQALQLRIKLVVITDRRPHSLSRLLQSAAKSTYLGDQVDLTVHMEQSADRVTRMLVNSFMWRQGQKMIRHRIRKGGLMPAIVESWYPSNNDEYAVLLEDDIEVSPLFYVWSKYAILKYRYSGNSEAYRLMYGISLYAPRNLELVPAGRVTFDPNSVLLPAGYAEHIPYASQVPCSWGGVYFPEHWREFHAYLVTRLNDLNLPKDHQVRLISVPGSRSDKWKKSWKKYFIEMVYLRASVMLYPNFQHFEAFSTNHVEFGTHVKSEKRQSVIGTFMVPLMQRDTILSQLPNQTLPLFEDLPVLDLWGKLQSLEILETIAAKYHAHISICPRTFGTFDPQEFFCRVDGPPDPLQEFPMAAKQPKPPILIKDVVQPIEYQHVYEYTAEEEENARTNLLEYGPKPIDVAQLPFVEEKFSNKDDEMLDLENDLDTLNRLYLKLNPENLEFLKNEIMDIENEEEIVDDVEEEEDGL